MKNLILVLLLLSSFLLIKRTTIADATIRNLEALSFLKVWKAEPKALNQIICEKNAPSVDSIEALQARQTYNANRTAVVNAARMAYFSGDCAQAFDNWKLAVEADPHDSSASLMLYLSSGLDREVFPANISEEEMATYLFKLGLLASEEKAENQAEFWFIHSLEIRPSRAVADRLTLIQQSTGEQKNVWQKLAESLPEDDSAHWWALGKRAELDQQWIPALEAYKAGAGITPDPYRFLVKQGLLLMKLDRLNEAEDAFREGASLKPDRSQPLLYLGNIFRRRGDHVAARVWYEQAVELAPDEFIHNYNLGLTHYQLNQHDLAEKYLSRAVKIDPQNNLALYYLAQTVYHNGQRERAQTLLEEAVFLDEGSHWEWLVLLGDWKDAVNDREGAIEAYYQALDLNDHLKIIEKIQKIENP